jgi:aryl-alcohol dehydrogenase-like predicted oxidoreductase
MPAGGRERHHPLGGSMEYRPLGSTGLHVSVLAYGASSLGGVFRSVDESAGIAAVHAALDLGINLVDVSPYYGLTVAETVLGRALRGVDRGSYLLATKVGRYGDAEFDFSAERVRASVHESMARLGVDYLDVVQCHDIEFGNLDQIVEETLPALEAIRDQGLVRFIGVTGFPVRALASVARRHHIDTVMSYCNYTIQNRNLLPWLGDFDAEGIGVMNASPLGMGLLTNRGVPAWHLAPAPVVDACSRAAALCATRGSDIAKLAIQFAVRAAVATTVVGTADASNMARNVAWIDEEIDLELLQDVEALLAPVRDIGWSLGRPENADPVEISSAQR